MIAAVFPLKKVRRSGRKLLFLLILLVGAVAVYHEMVAARAWSTDTGSNLEAGSGRWRGGVLGERVRKEDSAAWRSSFTPQTWKPEYMGRANLHVFEDWCGSSTADLSRNLHYPLYPHSRTMVTKLAVVPRWTNYGLRIFGYIHPYSDGEFVFALSSDDNSEFWLSQDESPINLQLLAWVGKTGREWTAPGEYDKYASQTSRPVWLSAQRRYFFEVVHKQNDRGTDHVELAWKLLDEDSRFMVIESHYISLYVDESALLMSDVAHIPQTAASHRRTETKEQRSAAADMLREDLRDTFHKVPLMNSKFLRGVLPDCTYKPSYIIKDFPLDRYQGLQFVHMSYIYPNDYTRLSHMETENSCFYHESPYSMKMFGFTRFMRLDRTEKENNDFDPAFRRRSSMLNEEEEMDLQVRGREKESRPDEVDKALFPDYGDDYDDYLQKRKRKLFSINEQATNSTSRNISDARLGKNDLQKMEVINGIKPIPQLVTLKPAELKHEAPTQPAKKNQDLKQRKKDFRAEAVDEKPVKHLIPAKKLKPVKKSVGKRPTNVTIPKEREQLKINETQELLPEAPKQPRTKKSRKRNNTIIQGNKDLKVPPRQKSAPLPGEVREAEEGLQSAASRRLIAPKRDRPLVGLSLEAEIRKRLRDKEIEVNMPLQPDPKNNIHRAKMIPRDNVDTKPSVTKEGQDLVGDEDEAVIKTQTTEEERDSLWELEGNLAGAEYEDLTPTPVFDPEVKWNQTFQVNQLDLQAQRSDWIDLQCNISGNLLLQSSDALPIAEAFMEQLNQKHHGRFKLLRVINVVKRVDGILGSRYLLELELKDSNGQLLRLSHYIYALIRHSRPRRDNHNFQRPTPELLLCNPVGFHWNPAAVVHIIVPVKNQARWVQQLISDMEQLFRETGDTKFNLIIIDYDSTDMDVRTSLQTSKLHRFQYVKLSGNFERSAGLQAGIDLIEDSHSIVFLCDLHIHFPPSILDSIRKHCVEGFMAFAPIVHRLDCGSTPSEARGYWEVNGFGLLGIYKSDLDAIGGMNTKEFTSRWGGEDWELLDRILQGGLEVDRIFLRNFFHHYHSKRGMWNRQMVPNTS